MRTAGIVGGMKYKMREVLISTRPKWCEKICHEIGKDEMDKPIYEKRIEVRKSAPKEVPFKAYIYCTKGKDGYEWLYRVDNNGYGKAQSWHGKVIGEFICDRIIEWKYLPDCEYDGEKMYYIDSKDGENTCLLYDEIEEYGKGKTLYGWHISDLKIYDKPRELSEFTSPRVCGNYKDLPAYIHVGCNICEYSYTINCMIKCRIDGRNPLTRPPQSWQFVEELGNE